MDLTLVAERRRGHGAMYDALNRGNVDVPRLLRERFPGTVVRQQTHLHGLRLDRVQRHASGMTYSTV
ncbi:hypothetical protein ABTZ58_33275 [Streptomyces sp. NPDC094143]|uniref:hypothetical protein n=1 Tax=Streptomyces sp. NPDC094143 TaxID=3155310 RepID=UPI00331CAD86